MAYMREGGMRSEVLGTRSGGGCLMLFGLPFLLAGLAVMISPTGIIPAKNAPPPWFFAIPFGLVFATVGAAFVFGRAGVKLDRANRTVTRWWGLLAPFKSTVRSLDEFEQVTITKEVRRSKNSTYTVYPVKLVSEGKDICFEEPQEYQKARKKAEEVAGFLEFRIMDCTSGTAVWRSPEEFDESLRERARRTGEAVAVADPPELMRTQVQVEDRQVILDLPAAGFTAQHVAPVVMGWLFIIGAGIFFVRGPFKDVFKQPRPMNYIFMGFVAVFMLMPLLGMIASVKSAFRRDRVIASPDSLQYQSKGLIFTRTKYMPADEMEELVLPNMTGRDEVAAQIEKLEAPAVVKGIARALAKRRGRQQGILARSDKLTIEFGKNLADDELVWLHAVIMKMMTV